MGRKNEESSLAFPAGRFKGTERRKGQEKSKQKGKKRG